MGYCLELAPGGNAFLQLAHDAITNLHQAGAPGANQMMLMPVMPFLQQGKPCNAVLKVKPFDHSQPFQQLNRAINRRQIAPALRQFAENLLTRQRTRSIAQSTEDRPARSGDFARLATKALVQIGSRAFRDLGPGRLMRHDVQCTSTQATPSPVPTRMAPSLAKLNRCSSLVSNRMVVEMCMKMPMTMAISSRE